MKGVKSSALIQVTHEKNPMQQVDAVLIHICFFLIKRPNEAWCSRCWWIKATCNTVTSWSKLWECNNRLTHTNCLHTITELLHKLFKHIKIKQLPLTQHNFFLRTLSIIYFYFISTRLSTSYKQVDINLQIQTARTHLSCLRLYGLFKTQHMLN